MPGKRTPPIANSAAIATQIRVLAINENECVDAVISDPAAISAYLQKYPISWISVVGLANADVLQKIGVIFNINPLAMEDITDFNQRPKVEEYTNFNFAVSIIPELNNNILHMQQISFFWSKNFVVTFIEKSTNCFDELINRIKRGDKRHLFLLPEYAAYAILDAVIDEFFPILENYGLRLDDLEQNAIDNPSTWVIRQIHNFKHDLNLMRRTVWAQRDAVVNLKELFAENQNMWFHMRDCEDHTIQLLDIVESFRDRSSGLMDIYLVSVSNRTNKIVKQLTIIATVFMPIGVLAGIYGMNFDRSSPWNLPELGWHYGYEYFWLVVVTFASSMLITFWKRGWFKQ